MAVEQLDNSELWVEDEIARQLQKVLLDDENSDYEAAEEPDVPPESEPTRRGLYSIFESYKESLQVQLQHGIEVVRDAGGTLQQLGRVLDKSSLPLESMPALESDSGSHSNIVPHLLSEPPKVDSSTPVSVSSSLQETLSKLEEEGQLKADLLNQELTMREATINAMIEEAERRRKDQEEMMAQRASHLRTRAAIKLQSEWRGHLVRQKYCKELHRMKELRLLEEGQRRQREREEARNKAAILVQSCWRGYVQRCKFGALLREHRCEGERRRKRTEAAVVIQAYWRKQRDRRMYLMEQNRRKEAELALRKKEELEVELAKRKEELEVELAKRKEEEEQDIAKKVMVAILIQSFWRGCIVRKCVVPALMKQKEIEKQLMVERKVERAAITIQKYWRRLNKKASIVNKASYFMSVPLLPPKPPLTLPPQPSCHAEATNCRDMASVTVTVADSSRDQTTPLPFSSPSPSRSNSDDTQQRSSEPHRRKLTLKRRLQSALMMLNQPSTDQTTSLPAISLPDCQSSQLPSSRVLSPTNQTRLTSITDSHRTNTHLSTSKCGPLCNKMCTESVVTSPQRTKSEGPQKSTQIISPGEGEGLGDKGNVQIQVRTAPAVPLTPTSSSSSSRRLPITRSNPSISPIRKVQGTQDTSSSSSTPSLLLSSPPPVPPMPTSFNDGVTSSVCPTDVAIGNELSAMASLQRARRQEEGVADGLRNAMNQMVSKETLAAEARERRAKSSHAVELEHFSTPFSPQAWLGLVEERRVQWSKSHIPWREPLTKQEAGTVNKADRTGDCTKKPRMKSEAKPLSDLQLLSASPPGTQPSEVVQVSVFRTQFPIDLFCLSRCPRLQVLTISKCVISSLCSLSSCSQLVELNLQANALEQLTELADCLDNVQFMDLSGNRLTSFVGLEHCPELLELSVCENRITRITKVLNCSKLQKLTLDNNLLVNSSGLEAFPSLNHLSCVGNHLPRVSNLTNSPLLQYLNLQQNNLCEAPPLLNHVLLREIRLEENTLSDVQVLTNSWLPLLQYLSLANNSISSLDSLSLMLSLRTLDIRNNSLCDLPLLLHALRGCFSLSSLTLDGNPLTEDPRWKKLVKQVLPSLIDLNDEVVTQPKGLSLPAEVKDYPLYQLCSRQLKEQDELTAHHSQALQALLTSNNGSPDAVANLLNGKTKHHREWHNLLVQHLHEHEEYGDERIIGKRIKAAMAIQAVWKGRKVRREVAALKSIYYRQTAAATVVQNAWRRYCMRRVWLQKMEERRNKAAILIQSHFRGYWLRKRLKEIIDSARYEDSDEDLEYEEVLDLSYVDEGLLERDIELINLPDGNSQLLGNATLVGNHNGRVSYLDGGVTDHTHDGGVTDHTHDGGVMDQAAGSAGSCTAPDVVSAHLLDDSIKSEIVTAEDDDLNMEDKGHSLRQQAWIEQQNVSSENTGIDHKHQEPDHYSLLENRTPRRVDASESIAQEWGFKDLKTTEMMLRRALKQRNLIAKANRRKKMENPSVRLACFRRLEESHYSVSTVSTNPSNTHASSLQAVQKMKHNVPTAAEAGPGLVYQWAHSYKTVTNPLHQRGPGEEESGSLHQRAPIKCSLPQLDPHVLAGYKARLVSADALNHFVQKQKLSFNKDVR